MRTRDGVLHYVSEQLLDYVYIIFTSKKKVFKVPILAIPVCTPIELHPLKYVKINITITIIHVVYLKSKTSATTPCLRFIK